jgi:hypothetical protein
MPADAQAVEIADFAYDPEAITVEQGTSVAWTNAGVAPHTVTARDGTFDSGLLQQGGQYVLAFDRVGEFEYFCTIHPNMVAAVTVVEAGSLAPIAAPAQASPAQGGDGAPAVAGFAPAEATPWAGAFAVTLALLLLGGFAVGVSMMRTAHQTSAEGTRG